jgi:hypothetical protein
MTLQQRKKGVKVGGLELVFVILLLLTLIAGANWLVNQPGRDWQRAPAYITGIAIKSFQEGGANSQPQYEIRFTYEAQGRKFYGVAQPTAMQSKIFVALPKSARDILASKGYVDFSDLPMEVRQVLESRGVSGFDNLPAELVRDLRARGYASERDLPENVRIALRSGNAQQIASALDGLLPVISPSAPGAEGIVDARTGRVGVATVQGEASGGQSRGALMSVLYNPSNPSDHKVSYLPGMTGYLRVALFAASIALVLLYAAFIYPWLKDRLG